MKMCTTTTTTTKKLHFYITQLHLSCHDKREPDIFKKQKTHKALQYLVHCVAFDFHHRRAMFDTAAVTGLFKTLKRFQI